VRDYILLSLNGRFVSYYAGAHRDLHSFPTRRSSDLGSMASSCNVQRVTGRLRSAGMVGPLKSASRTPVLRPDRASARARPAVTRSEEHTSELQSRFDLVCRLLLEKKKKSRLQIQGYT